MDNHIHIFLATDDNYAPWCGITIQSVKETTTHPVDFYIASHNISIANQERLKSLQDSNININIITINEMDFKQYPVTDRLPLSSYVRLEIADLLPNCAKILYLDCDIIVQSDLWDLWRIDLKNFLIAAVPDANSEYVKKMLSLDTDFYINAGVMLIDLNTFRKKNIKNLFANTLMKNIDKIQYADQDIINLSLAGKILKLPSTWNSNKNRNKKDKIIHFIWDKPWNFSAPDNKSSIEKDRNFYKYWKIVKQSPWAYLWEKYKRQYYFYILNSKCRKIKQFIFEKIKSNKTKKYKIFGLTIIKKTYKNNQCIFRFLGIPIFSNTKKRDNL